ncbi:MAG: lytic transglycosylase domain-containing protein [Clostridia bacterium]|nr:lytic transglycosylase domain-containing protein [Clostridia bacterium]
MAEKKPKKKNKKAKKGIVAYIIAVSIIGLMITVPFIVLSIISTMRENAEEQLNKSMYPLKYESYVEKYSKEFDVDKCLVYGVIKNESNFDPEAVSPVGAIGLMQLMPDTFTWLQNYRTDFMPDKLMNTNKLYEPKINIEYGVYLLRFLLEHYNGNTDLVICAYNAGYGHVDDWLADGTISADNVIAENVPFPETSNYLVKVSSSAEKYREIYFPDYVYTFAYSAEYDVTDHYNNDYNDVNDNNNNDNDNDNNTDTDIDVYADDEYTLSSENVDEYYY